jgi:methyl-accepting chemotaxis protein
MGFLDRLKGDGSDRAVEQAKEQAAAHDEDIEQAIDRVADLADQATDGKFTEKIDEAAQKLKDAADRLDEPGQA